MARLIRVVPGQDPGFRRVRSGSGFRYVDPEGIAAPEADQERIHDLVIPPAWHDVWIAADPLAHIQAVGIDGAGRKQYLYHPLWRVSRDRRKFVRALDLAAALPRARAQVTRALAQEGQTKERALAIAFRLLDDAALRIGSERYLVRHGSRGLTTLRRRDVRVEGDELALSFPAKSGRTASIEITDAALAEALADFAAGKSGAFLLAYRRGRRRVRITPVEVNTYLGEVTGASFTAKDFRTLHGTIIAADALARIGELDSRNHRSQAERLAVQAAATALGNTTAVARGSYIDPRVFGQYARGRTLDLTVTPETAIRRLLGGPEISRKVSRRAAARRRR
ncbi:MULTISPECIES: DNA topoisomerase IB [unclassified Microbacterium]|uniref:DNA topoisomerase IB n=1 Tax=unclassified Microbacterium TaxID=2609290 RepID=UPI000CFAEAB2|nr:MULTISPECIES: DNA topoisomerase IB [unclassified Microbacterium]PQZ61205.1 topoisomerase I [Microbacterium sp. MYb43]PQZ82417.1 topoisomerase I [Microbacterium sp. MYb40]PRB23885.1 topoisomerase I [Microbacterium sp. MYb54]PRB29780.1 topoisomerase I [Microbacterium sp. MYb50]PRB70863.1 topoisomerase I [Microbacterium sp. MYb24]